uniref:Uncharacterized protein n=1 Tax=Sphaerodactylus townsendi TaxID=933632 RepID=A0ACB8G1B4_9SAUR
MAHTRALASGATALSAVQAYAIRPALGRSRCAASEAGTGPVSTLARLAACEQLGRWKAFENPSCSSPADLTCVRAETAGALVSALELARSLRPSMWWLKAVSVAGVPPASWRSSLQLHKFINQPSGEDTRQLAESLAQLPISLAFRDKGTVSPESPGKASPVLIGSCSYCVEVILRPWFAVWKRGVPPGGCDKTP